MLHCHINPFDTDNGYQINYSQSFPQLKLLIFFVVSIA